MLTALAVSVMCAVAHAAVELEVSVGFGGHVKLGEWAPVRVILDNKGEATRGELVIPPQAATDEHSDYRVSVDVPASSRRALILYARPRVDVGTLDVEFRPQAGPPVRFQAVCTPHDTDSRLVVVISRRSGGLGAIGRAPIPRSITSFGPPSSADSVVAYVSPDRTTGALGLPDRPTGYGAASAVVLRDISPDDFESFERDALVGWVESGGLLVIMASPSVSELRDSFIEKLAPVRIRGQRVLPHLGALAEHFRANLDYGRALVADTEPKPQARVIVSQEGLPLLASRRQESGTVYFCAADCGAPPLDAADLLLREMWSDILEDQPPMLQWAPVSRLQPAGVTRASGGLSDGIVRLPILEWGAFALLGGYLLVYLVVLVAVSLVLKSLDRREWAGQALLALIALFSLGALYLGTSAHLASSRAYDAAVVAVRSGAAVGWREGIAGVRCSAARRLTVSPAAEDQTLEFTSAAQRVMSWPVYQQGSFALRRMPVDLWGFGGARVQGPWRMDGRITARLAVVDEQRVAVSIENGTSYNLRFPFVLLPGSVEPIPEMIPAGETRETARFERRRLQALAGGTKASPYESLVKHCDAADVRKTASAEQRMRHRLLSQLGSDEASVHGLYGGPYAGPGQAPAPSPFSPGRPLFGAWIELPQPLVTVVPATGPRVSEALLLVDIPLEASRSAAGAHQFTGLLPVIDASTGGVSLARDGKITLSPGAHELRFRLPSEDGLPTVPGLTLAMGTEAPGVSAEVYNCRTLKWEPLRIVPGRRVIARLIPPEDYVRGSWVRVRLSSRRAGEATAYCALLGRVLE